MLTLFACPKPFIDEHIRTIQTNAICSWLLLQPCPQIILFGNETGTAEICEKLSLTHVPDVATNEFGTPLLNDIFLKAEELSNANLLCYVNADIILMGDLLSALQLDATQKRRFLMGARPWNLDVSQECSFEHGWQQALLERVASEGQLRSERSCDVFAFPRGLWGTLPPFATGRAYFDNALLHRARRMGAALVDATGAVVSVHQNHPYANHLDGEGMLDNIEAQRNVALAGGPGRNLTWKSSTHRVVDGRLRFNALGVLRFFGPWSRTSKLLRLILGFFGAVRRLFEFSQPSTLLHQLIHNDEKQERKNCVDQ